jgi:hypothetical protein
MHMLLGTPGTGMEAAAVDAQVIMEFKLEAPVAKAAEVEL